MLAFVHNKSKNGTNAVGSKRFHHCPIVRNFEGKSNPMTSKYSICVTCFNEARTVRESITSIISQINDDYELIVVDNESNDGTYEILQELSKKYQMKIIREKCTRGKGRQIAFENSSGQYLLANLDMDEIYGKHLSELVDFYHSKCEGRVLLVTPSTEVGVRGLQNVTIAPSAVATSLGGWHDLQWGEDWEFWCRAAKIGKYSWTVFKLGEAFNPHYERKKSTRKLSHRFVKYRELIRVGRDVFSSEEKVTVLQRITYLSAKFVSFFYASYRDSFSATFSPYDNRNFIDFKGRKTNLATI